MSVVRACGKLSPPFSISNDVRKEYLLPLPFQFHYFLSYGNYVHRTCFGGLELLPLKCANSITPILNSLHTCHVLLARSAPAVHCLEFRFAPSKCEVFIRVWQGPTLTLALGEYTMDVLRKFNDAGSYISDCCLEAKVTNRIRKLRRAFA